METTADLESRPAVLFPQQVKVLRGIAQGYTRKELVEVLGMNYDTVKNHTQVVMDKLGIHSRAKLMIYALKSGVISLDEIEMPRRER